ncbi:hypothetical protein SS50377_25944 [Spironucleus salmonicida]|uniref:Uncharacterized protein n=1 Tax=Spironucleus salmonicida TaxID=348837 RepID=V6LWP4_9EUKA|nr:hypothetical protein SS50377_25923 [Spironucleus salmonicida]KAH0571751.1 hypothetical protein SS50377_25944 [Spironucleus salmonicida]|eukprot:EST48136.1 Hypothetical protein SS50377_11715 [Spironucleus salmonicida]
MEKLVQQSFETQKQLFSQLLSTMKDNFSPESINLLRLAIDAELYPQDADTVSKELRELTHQQVPEMIQEQQAATEQVLIHIDKKKKKSRGFDGGSYTFGYEVIESQPATLTVGNSFIYCERSGDAFEMAEDVNTGKSFYAGCGVLQTTEGRSDIFFSQVRVKGSH